MPLDPQAQEFLEFLAAARKTPLESLPVEEARKLALRGLGGPPMTVEKVENVWISQHVPARVYRPAANGDLPLLVYFHGGGWVLGDLDTADEVCRRLACEATCVVVSVGYRLAPEHKFPTPLDDCVAAIKWSAVHAREFGAEPSRVAVGGDSAGGNLAACAAIWIRDHGGPRLAAQWLAYPVTDFCFDSRSYQELAAGYGLDRSTMQWYWAHYLRNDEDGRSPYASPLRASDLSGLPPAIVLTAEFDPLRDEGEAYAERLGQAGVPVIVRRYDGLIHGFMQLGGVIAAGSQALSDAASELGRLLDTVD